jgi:hypothetical protein
MSQVNAVAYCVKELCNSTMAMWHARSQRWYVVRLAINDTAVNCANSMHLTSLTHECLVSYILFELHASSVVM